MSVNQTIVQTKNKFRETAQNPKKKQEYLLLVQFAVRGSQSHLSLCKQ